MLTSQSSVLWDLQPGYRSFILCVENYFIEVSAPFAVFILMTSIQKNPVTLCRLELPGFEDARQVVESLHRMPIKENQAERNRWPAVNSQVCPPPSGAAHINESSEPYTQLPSLSHPHPTRVRGAWITSSDALPVPGRWGEKAALIHPCPI